MGIKIRGRASTVARVMASSDSGSQSTINKFKIAERCKETVAKKSGCVAGFPRTGGAMT